MKAIQALLALVDRVPLPQRWHRVLATLTSLVVLAAGAVTVTVNVVDTGTPGYPRPHATVTVTSHTPQGPVVAPAPAVQQAASDGETGLGHETISPQDEAHNDRMASPQAPRIEGPPPAAAPYQAGCTTRTNTHNFSFRNGVRPSIIPIHLTVSPNVTGWSDVNGNAIFLNRPATQASAAYIIDNEGHCLLTVPETEKSWNVANFNSAAACGIEVVNTGNEPTYAATAGLAKLARVVHDCAHRWGIPLQRASVSGSRVTRPGVIDHYHLGPAGGGHFDIHQFGAGCRNQGAGADTWKCVDVVIAAAKALDGPPVKPVSRHARADCQDLNGLRKRKDFGTRATKLKKALTKHGYVCTYGPPGKIARR